MGRRRKKIVTTEEDYDWPFEISIDVKRSRPRIAFFSGCPREYYPDDPGFSKFSNVYCLPDPEDMVACNYTPSEDRLNKPVSELGYGIGGLCAPRFAKNTKSDTPAPNAYQDCLVPAPVKRSEKAKKAKWREFEEKYETLVEEQCAMQELAGDAKPKPAGENFRLSHDQRKTTADIAYRIEQPKTIPCIKRTFAFGTSLSYTRFAQRDVSETPGAGTYEPSLIPKRSSFQITNPNGKLLPNVRMVCMPGGCDTCMSCGIDLIISDYYQTKNKFKIMNTIDPMTYGKFKMCYLSFCRACYVKALKHGYDPWRKEKIPDLFMKARHCNSVHDHQEGHEEFLTKATCKGMLKLARKELLYSRYFKDTPGHKAI